MRIALAVVCAGLATLAACGDNLQGNRAPTASDSNVTTPEDTPVSITVTASDPDPGDGLQFGFSQPEHGTTTVNGGTVMYRPADDYHGPDSIFVDITDGQYETSATINITVTPVNDAPVAVDDALAGNEDTAATVTGATLVMNDEDADGDALTVTAVANPSTGTVGIVADTITFTPPNNFTGTATFEYTVSDGVADDVGTVTVTVGGQNDPPVAVDDTATTAEDTAATIAAATLVANDTDAEGQALSVTGVSTPTNGTVSLNAGTVTFTPTANFNGTAGFDYTVSDGAATDTGHVTVTVTPVNDTPVANAGTAMTNEDTPVTITLTGSDVESSALTFSIVTPPTNGTLGTITQVTSTSATVVYTPNANSTVDDTFTFRVNDGTANSAPATVAIDVVPQNDGPVANATTAMVNEDSSVTITVNGSDPDGDALTFSTVTGPATGTLGTYTQVTPTSATVVYTPNANSSADDSFTFRVNDGTANSAPATVTIDVVPQNDAPVANAQSVTTSEDTAVQITLTGTDLDADALTFATATGPSNGTLGAYTQLTPTSARVTYTPGNNYNGPDSFTFTVSDGTATSTAATVSITVTPVDDAPVAMANFTQTNEDTAVTITLIGSDPEGQALTFSIVTGPTRGSLGAITQATPTSATVVYTPNANNDQDDSFTFRVNDGGQDSAPATFDVIIIPVNDPPVAVDDTDTAQKNTDLVRAATAYRANDTDIDGPSLTITAVSNPTNGAVSINAGTITFSPTTDFVGTAGFDYTLSDGAGGTDTGHVTVTVLETNTPVVAVDDTDTVPEDAVLVRNASAYTANDVDPDPQTLSITAVTNPQNGAVSIDVPTQTITFTPNTNYSGPASFDYTVSDGLATDVGTVNITVTPTDDLPVAANDTDSVNEDGSVNTNVLANDTGLGDGGIVVTVSAQATNGTAVAQGNNTITYTPNPNFNGTDVYSYTVTDADNDTATGVVTITVNPQNDAPTANPQTLSMNENTVLTVTLSGSDIDLPPQTLTFAIATPPASGTLGAITPTGPTTATVNYTPPANFTGAVSFTYTANDGTATSAPATVAITVNNVPVCGDGVIEAPETCDDNDNVSGDGCSGGGVCQIENGWNCTGQPSACNPICNDGLVVGNEDCDDGDNDDNDGCTTQCQTAQVCGVGNPLLLTGDAFSTDPATAHCYVSFDNEATTFANAQALCVTAGGHLVTITSAGEQARVHGIHLGIPWIGAQDDGNTTDSVFTWVTGEAWGFTAFNTAAVPPEPDNDVGFGGNGDCLVMQAAGGEWGDTNCTNTTYATGRVCELPPPPCGDGTVGVGEECDDSNARGGDGCSATCQLEDGCGDGNLDAGENCDDDNLAAGDGCNATCKLEKIWFSEYVEGSGNNKALEIRNPFPYPINLTGCQIDQAFNGANTFNATNRVTLTATVAANDVHVVCTTTSAAPILAACDQQVGIGMFNGDDYVQLSCSSTLMDSIGQLAFDPGTEWGTGNTSTADNTIRRKCTVTAGDTTPGDVFDPSVQWDGFAVDTFAGLGSTNCP